MKVVVHSLAEREMREALTYYAELSDRLPGRLRREFDDAMADIAANPRHFYFIAGEWRKRRLVKFPYGVIYREVDDEIQVVAVAHHKRRPHYWAGRTF